MKKNILYFFFLVLLISCEKDDIQVSKQDFDWTLTKDNQGWTILNPSSDSRLIYVSNANGNDETAQTYSMSEIGNDPRDPSASIHPYKTIEAAIEQVRDGYPDWVLLARGETWVYKGKIGMDKSNGRNTNERIVFTYFGISGNRPVIKTEEKPIKSFIKEGGVHDWAFIGIEWYAYKHDPNSTDYDASLTHTPGTQILGSGTNLLFEDCKFSFVEIVIQADDGYTWDNVEIRRNILTDTYFANSCETNSARPSAAFLSGVYNYLIEENMVDHSGWSEDISGSGRNMYNHGWYLQYSNRGELIFTGNIMSRCSANAVQNRSGGIVEKNLSIQCPTGIYISHDTSHGAGANAGITRGRYNVVTEGLWMGDCPKSSGANWGLPLKESIEDALIEENIISHNIDPQGVVEAIQNISTARYLNNIVYDFDPDQDMSDDSWTDPDRTVASYNASIGGTASTEEFINSARNRGVHEWPYELSAYAIIDYFREGFNLAPLGPGLEPVD